MPVTFLSLRFYWNIPIHLISLLFHRRSHALVFRLVDGIEQDYSDSFQERAALCSKVASMPKVKNLYIDAPGLEP
jgi:hypothetical protein